MALREAFCPNCGQPTQIDDRKEFCFCLSCGNKIQVPQRAHPAFDTNTSVAEHEPRQRAQRAVVSDTTPFDSASSVHAPEGKMKEVEFYYKLSAEKQEYAKYDSEPTYYIKGQDLLVDLSQQYPDDYCVWWEMCKPMDFAVVLAGGSSPNPSGINSTYFDKALGMAPLDKKMELVKQHDSYVSAKNAVLEKAQAEQRAKKAEERAKEEERLRQERAAEEERLKAEEEKRKAEAERQEQERLAAEEQARSFEQAKLQMSSEIWISLANKGYSCIDNSYFQFKSPEGMNIIATIKVVANVLYLSAYHIDPSKGNQAYLDQSLAIHFGAEGVALKFDNKPVVVRGWNLSNNVLNVTANPNGGCMVNNIPMTQDMAYVNNITKAAKKPLIALKRIFS